MKEQEINETQEQVTAFDAIRGNKGTHYDLANQCKALGLVVEPDPDNNVRSLVLLPGVWNLDGSDVVLGVISGDSDAEIS